MLCHVDLFRDFSTAEQLEIAGKMRRRNLVAGETVEELGMDVGLDLGQTIPPAIVDDHPFLSVLLVDKEDRRSKGRIRRSDTSILEVLIEEYVEFLLFVVGEGVDSGFPLLGFPIVFELDLMTFIFSPTSSYHSVDHAVVAKIIRPPVRI